MHVQERILWLVAVLLVGGAAFYGGQQMGYSAGQLSQTQAADRFFTQRGGNGAAGRGQGGAGGQNLTGVVDRIDGTTIVVTLADNSTKNMTLAANGTVRRQVDGTLADLKPGERIVAFGTDQNGTFQANSLQIGNILVRPTVTP